MKKLLLVDFSPVFRRTWHATESQDLSAAHKLTVAAIHGASQRHDHTAVCLDAPPYHRKTLFPAYKATREAVSQQMLGQQVDTIATLKRLGLRCFESQGFEGDDLIATFVAWAGRDFATTILGNDKDLFQLLAPEWPGEDGEPCGGVRLHNHATDTIVDVEVLRAKRGISPGQVPCYLALLGDKSDNLPGVAGVGEKRAAELLAKYGSLEGIYDALQNRATEFKPAQAAALREAAATVMQVRELIRLSRDVPIDCDAALLPPEPTEQEGEDEMAFDESDTTDSGPPAAPSQPQAKGEPAPAPTASDSAPRVIDAEFTPMPAGNRALAIVPAESKWALEPRDVQEAWSIACKVFKSRQFAAYGNQEAVLLVIMAGREFGMGTLASLRSFHIIDGKPCMSAQAMMGLCAGKPELCKEFRVLRSECSDEKAVVRVQRPEWDKPERYEWTRADAERAGLTQKKVWKSYPRDMLINRAMAEAARFTWPELLAGVYTPEEMGDEREVSAA